MEAQPAWLPTLKRFLCSVRQALIYQATESTFSPRSRRSAIGDNNCDALTYLKLTLINSGLRNVFTLCGMAAPDWGTTTGVMTQNGTKPLTPELFPLATRAIKRPSSNIFY